VKRSNICSLLTGRGKGGLCASLRPRTLDPVRSPLQVSVRSREGATAPGEAVVPPGRYAGSEMPFGGG